MIHFLNKKHEHSSCLQYLFSITLTLISLLNLFFSSIVFAATGTTGSTVLLFGSGARSAGLGDSYVAVAEDIDTIYWNPAGLGNGPTRQISGTWYQMVADINYQFYGAIIPLNKFGIGLGYYRVGMVPIEYINELGNSTGELLTWSDTVFTGSIGIPLSYWLSLGLTAKYVTQSLTGQTINSVSTDFGILYRPVNRIQFGLVGKNFGTELNPVSSPRQNQPNQIWGGLQWIAFTSPVNIFNLSVAAKIPTDGTSSITYHFGTELKLNNILTLRLGYKFSNIELTDPVTTGLSLNLNKIIVDLAYIPFLYNMATYRVTVSIKI